jgi:hypothetical protein
MRGLRGTWILCAACFLLAALVTYGGFVLAWAPVPRFVSLIAPGAYIAAALGRILGLSWSGGSVWFAFFGANVLFWFVVFGVVAWSLAKARSRWLIREAKS